MIPVVTKQAMRDIDAHMINEMHIPSLTLMENAAQGVTLAVTKGFGNETPVIAVCGTGNNGGDGFAAARQLEGKGYNVTVLLVGSGRLSGDAAANASFFHRRITEITDIEQARKALAGLDGCVIIDALFGTGLSRSITGLYAQVIELINGSGAYVISCDIPSGIDADTGAVLGAAVRANETVTFQYPKRGHYLFPGREYTGKLSIKEIGVDSGIGAGNMRVITDTLRLEKRKADTHKGSYGRLALIAGSRGFAGAAVMCVKAALRGGAGLVTAGVPESLQQIISITSPEAMMFALAEESGALSESCIDGLDALLAGKTALAAGPGLGTGEGAKKAVYHMIRNYGIRKVFDADALNVIADDPEILIAKIGDVLLTPHPGEFSRLSGMSLDDILKDPITAAEGFAARYRVTLLLKGATTIVTNGSKTALIPYGSPGMAKGGSGDVLTGIIGSLMCGGRQGGMDAFPAALYGAYICAKAGEAAAVKKGEYSMTAMDTLENVPEIMKAMSG